MPDTVYVKDPDVVFRRIADECILVPVRRSVGDLDSIYVLNETAARVWELLDGKRSGPEIEGVLGGEFDVDMKSLRDDVSGFLDDMRKSGLVNRSG